MADKNEKMFGFIVFMINRNHGYIDNILIAKMEQKKGIRKHL